MSLDTYLPAGRGRYIVASVPGGERDFYYFIPEDTGHVKVGFLITRRGDYVESEYFDVVVSNMPVDFPTVEDGTYLIRSPGRGFREIELTSRDGQKRYMVFEQPRLGRFRFLSEKGHTQNLLVLT